MRLHHTTIQNLRFRYLLGLSAIALLVTFSHVTMQHIVSKQRDYSRLVNLAGHQAGLVNRIAYFVSLMAATQDDTEFRQARSQVGRTIHKIKSAHHALRNGDPGKKIPRVSNGALASIYDDPALGLDLALARFLERADQVYASEMEGLNTESPAYIYLTTYGPHVLEPLFDAAVDEYERIGRNAILKIEQLELALWLAAITALLMEWGIIFQPLEGQIRKALLSLESSISELTDTRKRLVAAQRLALVGDWELDLKTGGISWSDQVYEICGLSREGVELTRDSALALVHPEDRSVVVQTLGRLVSGGDAVDTEFRIICPSEKGERMVVQHAAAMKGSSGRVEKIAGTVQDITRQKQSEEQIRKLALYDSLTGLANRRLLMDRLAHALAVSRRNKNYGAVVMLDMDNFKSLNDTRGHDAGDDLLVEVARRLGTCVRETDTVARLGGDEFVVVMEYLGRDDTCSRQKAMQVAEKIRTVLGRAFALGSGQHLYSSTASIGVALFKGDACETEVLKRADVAMYEAKDTGRNRCCFYNRARQNMVNTRTAMAENMRLGLENNEFELYLQPQVLSCGTISGAEALLRWNPPGRAPVSPGEFIPVAESTGLILPLGEWVLESACDYLKRLETHWLPPWFSIAVNISARQFVDENFVEKVQGILDRTGIDPARLKLELTETCLVQDVDRGRRILLRLREMGLNAELDDFGTGYSSLNAIKNLPLTALKLDRSLIHGIETEGSSRAIAKAALAMAKAMGLKTVGEGVETRGQIDFLVAEGCDLLQGFYFARPMPYDAFLDFLDGQRRHFLDQPQEMRSA